MTYEKGPDLSGTRREDLDLSRARLHAPNFEAATITDGWFVDANISGDFRGLRLNGVEVAPLVAAELERRQPERTLLRADTPVGMLDAWEMIERTWEETLRRAREFPEAALHQRVDDEWSFVETLRHLVLATDCWLRRMVKGEPRPYHPWGVAGSWLSDPASWGLDPGATPTFDEVLFLRRQRMDEVEVTIRALTVNELSRVCVAPNTAGHPTGERPVGECLRVILNEEYEHSGYARRDLDALASNI